MRAPRKHLAFALACATGAVLPASASAHAWITSHQTRYGKNDIKQAPCGRAGGGPGATRYTYAPGATIEIVFEEYVNHPGYFRISFDEDGDDDFVDPTAIGDLYSNATVLLDNIPDADGGSYTVEVTLPDVECDNCTLQLAQIMSDKAPYGDGNDLYYNCVDIALVTDGDPSDGTGGVVNEDTGSETSGALDDAGEGDAGGSGCACNSGEPRGDWRGSGLLLLGLLGALRLGPRARRSYAARA